MFTKSRVHSLSRVPVCLTTRCYGGLEVSALAYCSEDLSSNHALYKMFLFAVLSFEKMEKNEKIGSLKNYNVLIAVSEYQRDRYGIA